MQINLISMFTTDRPVHHCAPAYLHSTEVKSPPRMQAISVRSLVQVGVTRSHALMREIVWQEP